MNKNNYEKDEIIKPRKKVEKVRVSKAKHKHVYEPHNFERGNLHGVLITMTKLICSICQKEK